MPAAHSAWLAASRAAATSTEAWLWSKGWPALAAATNTAAAGSVSVQPLAPSPVGAAGLLGSEEQKRELLPGMASLDTIGAWALTEPSNGSDASALQSTAKQACPCGLLCVRLSRCSWCLSYCSMQGASAVAH